MKNKILYVGRRISHIQGGADLVNMRNQSLLEEVFPDKITYVSGYGKSLFNNLIFGANNRVLKNIHGHLKSGEYSFLFLSQSLLGRVAHDVKKTFPDVTIITFFHNIEIQYAYEYVKTRGLKALPFYVAVKYWERVCCKNTDVFITLNDRDSTLLKDIYRCLSTLELPISLEDKYSEEKAEVFCKEEMSIDYLFVGTAFFANVQAVQWFINKVMPYVKGQFWIIGKGMDRVQLDNSLGGRVQVRGYVEDLSEYYYRARCVVSPVFVGGGMKTKTAEALMYGKTIIGTTEAFEGYEIDSSCMLLCNSAEDFVDRLTHIDEMFHINETSRKLFNQYYSNKAAKEKLEELMNKLD